MIDSTEKSKIPSVDLEFCQVKKLNELIVHVVYVRSMLIMPEHVTKVYNTCDSIMPGRYFFMLDHLEHVQAQFHPKTLTMSADVERAERVYADAFIPHSASLKMLANFYLKMKKPKVPARAFDNVNDAMDWFKTFEIN
jgi:hypothetical protein